MAATTPATDGRKTKLTSLPLSYYRREGTTSLPLPLETRYHATGERFLSFTRQTKPTGEAQLVPFYNYTTSTRKE